MQTPTLQEMIYSQMNHFLDKSTDQDGQVSYQTVIDIASWTGAYIIRQRHLQNGSISEEEIQQVLGTIGNFCKENFGDDFNEEDFHAVSSKASELLQRPTFDADSRDYFGQFYS
ncbi:MAG: hypothetical protein WCY89_06790 [Flavobacteriaceae bacterium]